MQNNDLHGMLGDALAGFRSVQKLPVSTFSSVYFPILFCLHFVPKKTQEEIIIEFRYSWIQICHSIAFSNSCKKNMHFNQTALSHLHVRANLELSSDEEDDYSDEVK